MKNKRKNERLNGKSEKIESKHPWTKWRTQSSSSKKPNKTKLSKKLKLTRKLWRLNRNKMKKSGFNSRTSG